MWTLGSQIPMPVQVLGLRLSGLRAAEPCDARIEQTTRVKREGDRRHFREPLDDFSVYIVTRLRAVKATGKRGRQMPAEDHPCHPEPIIRKVNDELRKFFVA